MKNRSIYLAAILLMAMAVNSGFAQIKPGDSYAGGSIGLWAGIGVSVNYEQILKDIENLGVIGVGAEIGYATDKDEWSFLGDGYGWKYTYIPIFAFASFHYRLKNPKVDPFARLGLGYVYVNSKAFGESGGSDFSAAGSYFGFAGQLGIRYAASPNVWLKAAVGTPWIASVGADVTL